MSPNKVKSPHLKKNPILSMLREVVSDLREASDVEGAILVEGANSIIASDLPEYMEPKIYLPEIMAILEDWNIYSLKRKYNELFAQHIFDYNGCKVLAKKLKGNLTLFVMIQKKGYTSLAMLDIENSIRRINEIQGDALPDTPRIFDIIPNFELT